MTNLISQCEARAPLPTTIDTCSTCHGARHQQYQDHRGVMVLKACGRCYGTGKVFVLPALGERQEYRREWK